MNTYDVKCPVCGAVNHSLFLDLQAAVGGCIQAVYPFEDPVAIICNA